MFRFAFLETRTTCYGQRFSLAIPSVRDEERPGIENSDRPDFVTLTVNFFVAERLIAKSSSARQHFARESSTIIFSFPFRFPFFPFALAFTTSLALPPGGSTPVEALPLFAAARTFLPLSFTLTLALPRNRNFTAKSAAQTPRRCQSRSWPCPSACDRRPTAGSCCPPVPADRIAGYGC